MEFYPTHISKDLVSRSIPAVGRFEDIRDRIVAFEASLDDAHEVGVMLASFGASILMTVETISRNGDDLIFFNGYVDGQRAELILHVSQLNLLLLAQPRMNPDSPKRPIGFL